MAVREFSRVEPGKFAPHRTGHERHRVLHGLPCNLLRHVRPMLTDGRQDFRRNPLAERAGIRFAGAHDEGVESGLGHHNGTPAPKTCQFGNFSFVCIEVTADVRGVQPQGVADVLGDKPRLPVDLHRAKAHVRGRSYAMIASFGTGSAGEVMGGFRPARSGTPCRAFSGEKRGRVFRRPSREHIVLIVAVSHLPKPCALARFLPGYTTIS